LLEGDLDPVRDFQLDFGRTGPGILGDDHGRLDAELRILELAQGEEAGNPRHHKQDGGEIGDRLFFYRYLGQIHEESPRSRGYLRMRTCWS
jgi:hypothetical protein